MATEWGEMREFQISAKEILLVIYIYRTFAMSTEITVGILVLKIRYCPLIFILA